MACTKTIILASAALLLALAPAAAQQLENLRTPATSGTVGTGSEGRASGSNLSAGDKGPASETRMPMQKPKTNGRENGATQAGASDTTKELYEH